MRLLKDRVLAWGCLHAELCIPWESLSTLNHRQSDALWERGLIRVVHDFVDNDDDLMIAFGALNARQVARRLETIRLATEHMEGETDMDVLLQERIVHDFVNRRRNY